MTEREFVDIRNLLQVYQGCCRTEPEVKAWWSTLKNYDFAKVYNAVEAYIKTETRPPVPASIISRIPKANPTQKFVPRFETVNGKKVRVVQCPRCNDTGLVIWYDEEQRAIGRPCNCPAGHHFFRWGWLTREEKEEYIQKNGWHGENMDEDWAAAWERDEKLFDKVS